MSDCIVTKENLGISQCTRLPQMPKCMITTPQNFRFTAAQLIDPDFWQDALKDDRGVRIYLWPQFVTFNDQSEATVYQQTPLASLKVRDGRYQFLFGIKQDLCLHRAMFTHRANNGRVIVLDIEDQFTFTKTGVDEYAGLSIQLLDTQNLKISDGTVSTESPIYVVLANPKELNANGQIADVSAFVDSLARLTDVKLTLGAPITATDIKVAVTVVCDGTPVSGLVAADFNYRKTSDGTQQVVTVTDETDGVYTLHNAAFVDGTVNLVAADALTIDAYESTGAIAVNIP